MKHRTLLQRIGFVLKRVAIRKARMPWDPRWLEVVIPGAAAPFLVLSYREALHIAWRLSKEEL